METGIDESGYLLTIHAKYKSGGGSGNPYHTTDLSSAQSCFRKMTQSSHATKVELLLRRYSKDPFGLWHHEEDVLIEGWMADVSHD